MRKLNHSHDNAAYSRYLWFTFFLILSLGVVRSFFGADTTDEAFYLAIPYRFFLGDRPFIDQLSLHQTFTFFTYPLLWPWFKTFGSAGVVLYARLLYWLVYFFISLVLFQLLQRRFSREIALATVCTFVAFVSHSIPALSYNTLATAFLSISFLAMLPSLNDTTEKIPRALVVLSGLSATIYSWSYPTLALVAAIQTLLVWRVWGRTAIGYWLLGAASIAVPLIIFLLTLPSDSIANVISFSFDANEKGGGIAKVLVVLRGLFWQLPKRWIFLWSVVLLTTLLLARRAKRLQYVLLFVIFILTMFFVRRDCGVNFIIFPLSLVALLWLFMQGFKWNKKDVLTILVPAVLAGFLTAYTASDGGFNFSIGFIPGFLFLMASAFAVMKKLTWRPIYVTAMMILVSVNIFSFFIYVYRDLPVQELTSPIQKGPYKGIFSHLEKAQRIEKLSTQLQSHALSFNRVIVFDDFPAGVLMAQKPVADCNTWVDRQINLVNNDYRRHYVECVSHHNTDQILAIEVLFNSRRNPREWIPPIFQDPVRDMVQNCATSAPIYQDEDVMMTPLKPGCSRLSD